MSFPFHRVRTGLLSLLLVPLVLAGCDDDDPVTEITPEQAAALAAGVWEQAYLIGSGVPLGLGAAGAPPVARQTTEFQGETTVPCELSGSVTVATTAFLEEDGEGGTLSIVGVQTHSGCTFQVEEYTFTLDGAPSVTTDWDLSADGVGNVVYDGSMTGAVEVTADDGSGLCTFDVSWGGSNSAQGLFAFELSGAVCGRQVSRSLTVSTTS